MHKSSISLSKSALFIVLALTLTLAGCGKAEEKKVEAPKTEVKKEEKKTSVKIDKTSYTVGEMVKATYEVVPTDKVATTAWVGIVPSDTPHGNEVDGDGVDVTYQYLNGSAAGVKELSTQTITKAGSYDVRIYSDDSAGKELASVTFTVKLKEEATEANTAATLKLAKTTFAPGEAFTVNFTAPAYDKLAWVGIIPSSVAHGSEVTNDANDVAYKYMDGKTSGTLEFKAPTTPGKYDLRMNESDVKTDAKEVASVSFEVK